MEAAMQTMASRHNLIASDRVEGTPVRRCNGDKIGTIQRLMVDKFSGHVACAVVRFGGLLGAGEKHIALAWNRLNYDPLRAAYLVDIGDDEIAGA
jgi:hypothetical protein